ncbi:hypothetical protein Fmac_013090 [Flemingia macrophylla]|uniref:Uncharacterized protein n=1 Tax=Flemingia macrophylla TaxID=520843 RepID=A0ABD1MS57_9FABA
MIMDYEYENYMSLSKILSRRTSLGCSSRMSYYRSGEGVPFKWEMQPGIAKERPKEDLPPLLSPPPALLSLGLPKPCIPEPKPSTRSRLRFWKKRVKRGKTIKSSQDCFDEDVIGSDVLARLDCSSDSESVESSRGSSSSSWSSISFMKSPSNTTTQVYGRRPLTVGCFPMHVTRVFDRLYCKA